MFEFISTGKKKGLKASTFENYAKYLDLFLRLTTICDHMVTLNFMFEL